MRRARIMVRHAAVTLAAASSVAFATPACSSPQKSDATQIARDAISAVNTESDTAGITTALFAAVGRQVQISSAQATKLSFLPRGCVDVSQDDAKKSITYEFNGCVYLRVLKLSGTLTLTYAPADGGYDVTLSSPRLKLGASVTSLSGTAQVRADDAGVISLALHADLLGESNRGTFRRSLSRTVTWSLGSACFDAAGASEGQIAGRNVKITVGPWRRCRSQCPDAKSELQVEDNGRTFRVLFDGDDTAAVREDGEPDKTLTLACEK